MSEIKEQRFKISILPSGVRFTIGTQTFTLRGTDATEPGDEEHQQWMAAMLELALKRLVGDNDIQLATGE